MSATEYDGPKVYITEKHTELHECEHEHCDCFWCKVSRKEDFPTIREEQII